MGLGVDADTIAAIIKEMAGLRPEELAALTADQENDVGELSDGHIVNYAEECVKESYEADKDIRANDEKLWAAHETNLPEMADKEDWQSKIVLNSPFTTTMQAKALVRKGLMERPDFFGLEPTDEDNPRYKARTEFWEKALKYWTGRQDSFMPSVFANASEMGFSVGQSMGIKILLQPDENGIQRLRLPMIEPWKTYPDPDRQPMLPWSGLYNVHEEWVDYYQLRAMEDRKEYINIDQVRVGRSQKDATGFSQEDKEQERRKKGQTLHRNRYRKAVLVRELWGTILDENGDVVMPSATMTVCNGVVIRKARPCPFKRMRWPWVDFCPLPHLLRFHGYGLFEGVMSIWKFQNALLNLYIDNENWRINNMFEVDPNNLEDPSDLEIYPLKVWLLKRMAEGKSAIRPILKGDSNIQDVMQMWGLVSNLFENGSMVTELLKGQEGQRKDITLGEVQLKLQQSIGVFDSIGKDVERGGVDLLWAIKEVLTTFWGLDDMQHPSIQDVMGQDKHYIELVQQGDLSWKMRQDALAVDCDITIRGVSRLFSKQDEIQRLKELAALGGTPMFQQFVKPYTLISKIADNLNLPETIYTEEEVAQLEQEASTQSRSQLLQDTVHRALQVGTAAHEQTHGHSGKGGAPPEIAAPVPGKPPKPPAIPA